MRRSLVCKRPSSLQNLIVLASRQPAPISRHWLMLSLLCHALINLMRAPFIPALSKGSSLRSSLSEIADCLSARSTARKQSAIHPTSRKCGQLLRQSTARNCPHRIERLEQAQSGFDKHSAPSPNPPGRASKITEPPRPPPHGIPPPRARVFLASVPATKNAGSNVFLYALGGQGSRLQTPRSSAGKPFASCLKFPRQR